MAKRKTNEAAAEQTYLPGTEPVKIPALDKLIDAYRAKRDTRMAYTEEEVEAQTKLCAGMKEHQVEEYIHKGYKAVLKHLDKVKVSKVDQTGQSLDD